MATQRCGVICAGTIITDYVTVVDRWPAESSLSNILYQRKTGGGGPFNVIKDLRSMDESLSLCLIGLIGNDENGRWLIDDCRSSNIDTKQVTITHDETPTSYTYVISVESTGKRTFFNQRGTNALLNENHIDFEKFVDLQNYQLFYLGYLTLIDQLDKIVDGECCAGRVLKRAKEKGLQTVVDFVSVENKFCGEIARLTLPYVDHLIVNEVETGFIFNRSFVNATIEQIEEFGKQLIVDFGVRKTATIHFDSGAVCFHRKNDRDVEIIRRGSLILPDGFVKGAVGAGDAFAAGFIYGTAKDWPIDERLVCGICVATMCLTDERPCAGVRSIDECLKVREEFRFRTLENSSKLLID